MGIGVLLFSLHFLLLLVISVLGWDHYDRPRSIGLTSPTCWRFELNIFKSGFWGRFFYIYEDLMWSRLNGHLVLLFFSMDGIFLIIYRNDFVGWKGLIYFDVCLLAWIVDFKMCFSVFCCELYPRFSWRR